MSDFDVRFEYIDTDSVRGRLIRNPNYGGPSVGLNGWRWRESISNHTKPGFQAALEESIRQEGVRNPILVYSLPEGIFLTFGGSRLRACRATGRQYIPAIINDFSGAFESSTKVTEENYIEFFKDPPRSFVITEEGADYHYNLERARRHEHDEAGFAWVDGDTDWMKKEFPWVYK
jgi:hypothetical protein